MGRAWSVPLAVWHLMVVRRLGLIAAGVAFFSMLALFPALAAAIAIFGFLADPQIIGDLIDLGADLLPHEAIELIESQMAELMRTAPSTLGWASVISMGAAAWAARLGVDALIQGLTIIYGGDPRGGVRSVFTALALSGLLIVVGLTALAAMLVVPLLMAVVTPFIPLGSGVPMLAEALRWAISTAVMIVGLGIFYRYGPNRPEKARSPFLSAGLFLALVLWAGASLGFSIYLAYFDRFNEIYGSIGAMIVLMLWFYISAYAVLIGAALNYTLEGGAIPQRR